MIRSLAKLPNRQTRLAIAARVPCDPRTVEKYYDPDRPISMATESHVQRALAELGLSDPRAPMGGAR